MKKTLLAVTTLVSLGISSTAIAASLPTGSATLQWAGSVPAETFSGTGYWIIQDGSLGFTEGLLTFRNDASGIALNSASEIGFKVVKDEAEVPPPGPQSYLPGVDINPMKYAYTLLNIKVGINGLATTQDASGYFAVYADGSATPSALNTSVPKPKGLPTRLTIKGSPSIAPADLLSSGDDVVIMAMISVTPDDTAI